jgi:hypothetical protein
MSIKSWLNDMYAQRSLRSPDGAKSVDDSEWGVSGDILTEIVGERKQEVDNIILSKEQGSFLLQENVLKQEFSGRQEVPRYFPRSVFDNRAEEESRRVIREEFTRSFITISVYSDQPDVIESVSDSRDYDASSSSCIFHQYQPFYPSWPSTLRNTVVTQPKLKNYIHGETIDDRSILVKLKQVTYKHRFEPLFGSICLYCFLADGSFVRITEVHRFDLTSNPVRLKYSFLYNHKGDFASDENSPCLLSIPRDISFENLFLVTTVTKVLTGAPDICVAPYLKGCTNLKIDEAKHIELTKRLQDYRQTVGFGVLRVFDEQERCGQHGGKNVSFPMFAYRSAMTDNQLGYLIRELIPISHASPVPTPMTIQKAKAELIDMDIIFSVSDVGNSLKMTDSLLKSPKPPKIDDIDVVTSTEYYSTLHVDSPMMTDNPMSLDQAKSPKIKESKDNQKCPIVKLKSFFRDGMTQRPAEIIRHMYTTEESMLYLYPIMVENFKERNLCVQIELVEFSSTPTSSSSLSTAEHISIPCIINQNKSPYLSTTAYTDVFYHNKTPCLHDEIKIRLPEFINARHYLKFTVQHIHVKPRFVTSGNFLGGLLTSNQPKELDSSYVVLGIGYQPLLLNDGAAGTYILPDNEYNLQVTETLMGPVSDIDIQDGKRKVSNSVIPSVRFISRTLSAFNSSCPIVQRALRNFPQRGGYFPSSSHERFGDIYSGLSMKEYLSSKDKTYASEEVLMKIGKEFMTSTNIREIQKFFFVEFRFFYRLLTYQQLNDMHDVTRNSLTVAVEDKRSDDDQSIASNIYTNLRASAFISLVKLFSVLSEDPAVTKKETSRTGGKHTIAAYVELLFDEEEDSTTYRKADDQKEDTAASEKFRPSSFSYSEVYEGGNSRTTSPENVSSSIIDNVAEYFVMQSERFIFESVIQEIVASLDVPTIFTDYRGVRSGENVYLPQRCIRWWSGQLLYREGNDYTAIEVSKETNHPFDFEGDWFKTVERLHGEVFPSLHSAPAQEIDDMASEGTSEGDEILLDSPDITALPFLPKYDRLAPSNPRKLWVYEQVSAQWLSLMLAIGMKNDGTGAKNNEIYMKFNAISSSCTDYCNAHTAILSSSSHTVSHQDLRNQLANNSRVLFRLIWKSLCLRIVRDCLKTPIVVPDELLNIWTQLLALISYELSDPSLGLPQARRLTFAMAQFVRSLVVILAPNQFKTLFSTCLLAFNDTANADLLKLKLILLEELGCIDNFVAMNCPYTEDAPFSTLMVCGYPQDSKMLEMCRPDKYTSSGNYRYHAAIEGRDSLYPAPSMIIVPSWYALGLANEYLVLMRIGDSAVKVAALSALRNLIVQPFHDMRYNMLEIAPIAFSRISTIYLPLLLSFISGTDKLNARAFDSIQRKEILIITIGLLQSLSEKVLRELVRYLCQLDAYHFFFRMPISPPNRDRTSLYPPEVDQSMVNKCKIYNLQRLLHFALDTFERPPIFGNDPSNLQQAAALLVPESKLDSNMTQFSSMNADMITISASRSNSEIIPSSNNELTFGISTAIAQLEASSKTDDALTRRLMSPKIAAKSFGDGLKDLQAMVPFSSRGTTETKGIAMKSEKTPSKANMFLPPSSTDGVAERKRLADVVRSELSSPAPNESSRAIGNTKKSNDVIAVECALSVSNMTYLTVLRITRAMIEELPPLFAANSSDVFTGGDNDNLLHFISSILLLLLHVLYSSPSTEVTWQVFEQASWIIQNLGFHIFFYAAGDTLQDWLRKALSICYDATAPAEMTIGMQSYESPRMSPNVVRIMGTGTDGSSHFIAMLLYSCFNYTGSALRLKYIFLSISQEFITNTVNEDQGGFTMKRQASMARKRVQSSIDVLRDRFNTVFIKILKSSNQIAAFNCIPTTSVSAFLSSVNSLLSKVKIIVKAYAYIIKQIGVDRIIRYNYNGENSLDGSYDSIPQTGMDSNDMIETPKVVTPLRIDYHLTIQLLMLAAGVFDPLYLPRFHIFWLENIAMIHDIYGNVAESAITRLRIFDVCKNVADIWDTLWVPRPPIIWSDRVPSDNIKRDFFTLFIETLKGPRPQVWRDWYQYRQHMKTVLMKTISILSAAGIVRWEQQVSAELVNFLQYQGDNIKAAEEYGRLCASITRAATRGLDKFSMGNFYRVHFSGPAIPMHLRDKTFIYRDASNSHISEFQDSLKLSLSRLMDKGVEIVIGADINETTPVSPQHPAVMILGSIRPAVVDDVNISKHYFSHNVKVFKYEIPFTLNGKSHSQRIDEQYKKKITLTVEEPFPCTFVRQEVTRKEVIILNPLQVAVDDIKERIYQMERFLSMRSISDPSILQEMMRVLQGSIMPQVNAGVAEVAKAFLTKTLNSRHGSMLGSETAAATERSDSNATQSSVLGSQSEPSYLPSFDTKELKVFLSMMDFSNLMLICR